MHVIKLDLKSGLAAIDSATIVVDEKGILVGLIEKLCSPPIDTDDSRTLYRLLNKARVCENQPDVMIEVGEGIICAITFLFDLIEFFESSILESKVLKTCEKSSNLKFVSSHQSTATLDPCEWGQAKFFYDAKQGNLSLDINFKQGLKRLF